MNYTIQFDFTTVSKRGMFSLKSGEIDMDGEPNMSIDDIKDSDETKSIIAMSMEQATNKKVVLVTITNLTEVG